MPAIKKIHPLVIFHRAFVEFRKNDPLRLAGATAFFTTFALPAVLLILIQVFGLLLSPRFMSHQVFDNLGTVVGKDTADELHKILYNVRHLFRNGYEAFFGFLFLIFVSTTLLKVIKDSLNQLWNIRVVAHPGLNFNLLARTKSFAVILLAGILFMLVLLAESGIHLIQHAPGDISFGRESWPMIGIRQLISFILVTVWFSVLFKFLPDARPSWKTVLVGASFTSLLFTIGKVLLQWLLSYNNMETIYGASTSSVLLLLFVFYSSFIFYFGACFTRSWSEFYNHPIPAAKNAEKYEWLRVVDKKKR